MNYAGLYRANVEDSMDPQARSRVKVSVPSVGLQSTWAEACLSGGASSSMRGGNMPSPGTRVWVMFEGGDASRPVWMGQAV